MLRSIPSAKQPGVEEQTGSQDNKASSAQAPGEERKEEAALEAKGLPEVCQPTAAEIAQKRDAFTLQKVVQVVCCRAHSQHPSFYQTGVFRFLPLVGV